MTTPNDAPARARDGDNRPRAPGRGLTSSLGAATSLGTSARVTANVHARPEVGVDVEVDLPEGAEDSGGGGLRELSGPFLSSQPR